jgi:hypothetical protein
MPNEKPSPEEIEQVRQQFEKLLAKEQQLNAEYEAMTPEQRARVDKLREEDAPEFEFGEELLQRLADGSMSSEEAERWSIEWGRVIEERFQRRLKGE